MEFIEIQNIGTQTVDMSGVQIADFASTPYVFADGTSLAPGERIVVARNPAVLQQVYGAGFSLMPTGYGTANLSNGGETIRLLTAEGVEIQKITYTDDPPWPTSVVDGGGYTLVIIDPQGDGSDPANWQVSGVLGGTPGKAEQQFQPGDFDEDGDVDGRDFLLWQRQFGSSAIPAGAGADGDNSGTVDGADLPIWSESYGLLPGPIGSLLGPDSDPEFAAILNDPNDSALFMQGESAGDRVLSVFAVDALLTNWQNRSTHRQLVDRLGLVQESRPAQRQSDDVLSRLHMEITVDHSIVEIGGRLRLAIMERYGDGTHDSDEVSSVDCFFESLACDGLPERI